MSPVCRCLCSAQTISELITKLLNKLYTQQDFKMAPRPSNYPSAALTKIASGDLGSAGLPKSAEQSEALSMHAVKPSVLAA